MHNEGDSGNVVGDGNTGVRGVIRAADVGVGGVPAQVLRHLRLEATRTATPMVGINLLYGVESGRLQRLMRRLVETKASHWGRRYYICDASNHLSYDRPNRDESDDDRDANHRRSDGGHRCRDNQSRKEKQASETASTKDANSSGGNARGEEASCSMVGVVEPTILLALEAGKDFKAVDFARHHRSARGGWEAVLVPDVLYVLGVEANLLSASQLKENGVKLQDDGGEMLLVSSAGDVVARARYSGRVLYTNLRPCSTKLTTTSMEVVALRTIASATKSTPDMWHARLAYVGVDTIKSSAKHEIAASLDIKKPTADDLPCASCVGGKLAWHTFPVQGSDAENALDVVHIDLCGPFRVAANDGSFYFLLLKDRKTCYVWLLAELPTGEQFDNDSSSDDVVEVVGAAGGGEGELSIGEQFDDNDVVEVPVEEEKLRRSTRSNISKPPERLSYHACLPPTAYSTPLEDAEDSVDLIELDPDMHANPKQRWDIANMTRPRSVNIMKNHWVLMTKYHVDDTVAREKARLALDDVLTGTGWKKSQVDEALYLKVGNDGVACWVLVYVNDLLDASSSTALLKELKELLEAAFELREISPVEKYLGLEIVCDRPAWKLWLHQQVYVDKLRRRFINEE
ncbi:unnamed protein product [Closterium sp. NIES-54]